MEYLQAPKIVPDDKLKTRLLNSLLVVNFVALIITFALNFLGLPILKYHYLIHILITFLAIILFDFSQILPIILTLYFLEGQGRIIWEYANWSRIIFDSFVLLSVLKTFISKKKLIDFKIIPIPLVLIISLHFLWYAVEFFNLNSLSYFSVLAATKVYIYPILFFFALVQVDLDVYQHKFQKTLNFLFFIIIFELALTFYQFQMKEGLVMNISHYYANSMKDGTFAGLLYRPFGTAQVPGAIAIFFFLTVGFLFLKNTTKIGFILRTALISLMGFAIILCQVRSAFIKFLLIIIIIHIGEFFFFRLKAKSFIGFFATIIILSVAALTLTNSESPTGDKSIDLAIARVSTIVKVDQIKSSRLDLENFIKIATKKLSDNPLGLGPGLTGPVASMSLDSLANNRYVNANMIWTSDNLLIALIIDFGIGSIFYILMLIYIPTYLFRFLFIFYKKKIYDSYKVLLVCFSSIIIILVGNWGALGVTYNPESFAFWFFSALGFSTIAKYKRGNITNA